jgi:hypothetical protein
VLVFWQFPSNQLLLNLQCLTLLVLVISSQVRAMRKVRVLPSSLLGRCNKTPVEPTEAPPLPNDLVSLLVVGAPNIGKTSLVKSFVYHECIPILNEESDDDDEENDTTSRSTSSNHPEARDKTWSVGYCKKDVLFSNVNNSLKSLRVQLYDTSGLNPKADSTRMDRASDWNKLVEKASIILLVVALSNSKEEICREIKIWRKWLDNQGIFKPLVLMLHQSDLMVTEHHPSFWMEFGGQMASLCRKLKIKSWHLTSCCLESDIVGNSIDTAFREILGDRGEPYVQQTISATGLRDSAIRVLKLSTGPAPDTDDLDNTTTSMIVTPEK